MCIHLIRCHAVITSLGLQETLPLPPPPSSRRRHCQWQCCYRPYPVTIITNDTIGKCLVTIWIFIHHHLLWMWWCRSHALSLACSFPFFSYLPPSITHTVFLSCFFSFTPCLLSLLFLLCPLFSLCPSLRQLRHVLFVRFLFSCLGYVINHFKILNKTKLLKIT